MTKAKGLFLAIAFGCIAMVGGSAAATEFEAIEQDLPLHVPYGPFPPGPAGVAQAGGIGSDGYGGVVPAGQVPLAPGGVQMASCDMPCGDYCGDYCSDCASCGSRPVGLLNKLRAGHGCGGALGLSRLCFFCRGAGCGVCRSCLDPRQLCALLGVLAPYQEGGLCAQRWYDFSAEALWFDYEPTAARNVVLTRDAGGTALLSTGDVSAAERETGIRLTGAILFGAGGNLEMTYIGLGQWSGEAVVESPTGDLFSVISDFGNAPPGGFPQTDGTEVQAVSLESEFHSGEWNYRRRWVGPYCRFQGSWLAGIRYMNIREDFIYATAQTAAPGGSFFEAVAETSNSMTGFQTGSDLWWNVMPGVHLGVGLKGAILGNDADQTTAFDADALGDPILVSGSDATASYLTEFQATAIYRFTYSWSARLSYYALKIDNLALGASNLALPSPDGANLQTILAQAPGRVNNDDELEISGFAAGFEYIW